MSVISVHKLDGEIIRRRSGVLTAVADSKRVLMVVGNHPLGYSESSDIYITKDKGMVKQFSLIIL